MTASSTYPTGPQFRLEGTYNTLNDALEALTPRHWERLSQQADRQLDRLRRHNQIARYVAGLTGRDVVNSLVAALQLGQTHPQLGRKVKPYHIQSLDTFYNLLQSMVTSAIGNHARRLEARLPHEFIGSEEAGELELENPSEQMSLVFLRDLLDVLLPRLFQAVKGKPRQRAIVRSWATALRQGDLPDQQRHERHDVLTVRRQAQGILRELAQELELVTPTGREMIL